MDQSLQYKTVGADDHEEGMESCDRNKGGICAKKKESVLVVERRERGVRAFIRKQLRKGYIWPSKSPQTAPVFFVRKKDGKKRMVQDY